MKARRLRDRKRRRPGLISTRKDHEVAASIHGDTSSKARQISQDRGIPYTTPVDADMLQEGRMLQGEGVME